MADSKLFLLVGTFFFLLSLVVFTGFPKVNEKLLFQEISLVNNTLAFGVWKNITLPIHQRLYFFNITNANEFLQLKAKLSVNQVGPYTFRSKWTKENIRWHLNGTVSYKEVKTYYFVPEDSSGTLEDEIYTLNGPFVIASNYLRYGTRLQKQIASAFFRLSKADVIIKRSVSELTYDGYEDPIVRYDRRRYTDYPFTNGSFAWFWGKNGSDDGKFTVFTGEDDIRKLNQIDKWNGIRMLNYWTNDACNMINGSNGEMTHPLRAHHTSYTLFQPSLCRSISLDYLNNQVHRGIRSRRFVTTTSTFNDSNQNCFSSSNSNESHGVQNVSSCNHGWPFVISFPHFFMSDPIYIEAVSGLNPNWTEHISFIDVEPRTGITLDMALRFQLNIDLSPIPGIYKFKDVPSGLFPVYWSEIRIAMDKEFASFLKSSLETPKMIAYSIGGVSMTIAVVLLTIGVCLTCKARRRSANNADDPLLNSGIINSGSYCTDTRNKKSRSWEGYYNANKKPHFVFYSYNEARRKAELRDYNSISREDETTDDELLYFKNSDDIRQSTWKK